MNIQKVNENKEKYMDILLLGNPEEKEVNRYLKDCDLYLLSDMGEVRTICAVVVLKNRKCEIVNIATVTDSRGEGYGTHMMEFICEHYSNTCDVIYVKTESCEEAMGFYEKCGFSNSHVDLDYLKRRLNAKIDVKSIVDFAMDAGRILLRNGAEIFRVEETITRICKRFGVETIDIFVLSHAIFMSAENGAEEAYTKVNNVPLSSAHLGIVAEVNDLSRDISAGNVTLEEAKERLEEIDKIPQKKNRHQIIAAGFGGAFFGYMMGATLMEAVMAFFTGCVLWRWVLVGKKYGISSIIVNIFGGVIIAVMALVTRNFAFFGPLRIEGIITGSIMSMIPGVAFVNAVRDIADSDFLSGTVRMIDAMLVFVYLAVGVGLTFSVYINMLGGKIL